MLTSGDCLAMEGRAADATIAIISALHKIEKDIDQSDMLAKRHYNALVALREDMSKVLEDLRNGKFCSRCGNSKTEIERGVDGNAPQDFYVHVQQVKGVVVGASPDQIAEKETEFNRLIANETEQVRKHRKNTDLLKRRKEDYRGQIPLGKALWYDSAVAARFFACFEYNRRADAAERETVAAREALKGVQEKLGGWFGPPKDSAAVSKLKAEEASWRRISIDRVANQQALMDTYDDFQKTMRKQAEAERHKFVKAADTLIEIPAAPDTSCRYEGFKAFVASTPVGAGEAFLFNRVLELPLETDLSAIERNPDLMAHINLLNHLRVTGVLEQMYPKNSSNEADPFAEPSRPAAPPAQSSKNGIGTNQQGGSKWVVP